MVSGRRLGRTACWIALGLGLVALPAAGYLVFFSSKKPALAAPVVFEPPSAQAEASPEQVHQFCGACHAYPPADSFPRSAWRKEVRQAYDFFRASNLQIEFPSIESVALYYENRAPAELPLLKLDVAPNPPPLDFERVDLRVPSQNPHAAVTNVNLAHLFDKQKLDVLVCDMRLGRVLAYKPYAPESPWQSLGDVQAPAHAEAVDLDGDGIQDVIVANLGTPKATDMRRGSVVWLRGAADGTFTPFTLLDGVGRVADVQAGDFRRVGKLDLVVAVFGWRNSGEIIYLENQTTDWSQPKFVPRVLDDRHGTIHICVGDIDGDGNLDFAALISQEHETVVAFLNDGKGGFRKETIYTAPHPAYGSSGIQLVDINGDGKPDILYTNGDILDPPYLLKPYHGIRWLENRGRFPFEDHPITNMYGAMRAVAADFQGKGKLDIAAVAFLPPEEFPQRATRRLDSVIYLEQTQPGRFVRHSLETESCDHFTCVAGDVYGDGKMHLVTGNFAFSDTHPMETFLSIWKNLGPRRP